MVGRVEEVAVAGRAVRCGGKGGRLGSCRQGGVVWWAGWKKWHWYARWCGVVGGVEEVVVVGRVVWHGRKGGRGGSGKQGTVVCWDGGGGKWQWWTPLR